MGVAKQLYELQEIDLEIEASEQTLVRMTSQLGENEMLQRVRERLASENQRLEELKKQQHSLEWEIDDIGTKITALEKELYSGRIQNPKELTNLQHETSGLKTRRSDIEDKAIEVMEAVEQATASVSKTK